MKQSGRAWILLPAMIIAVVVIGVLVSSYQKEVGLFDPNVWGRTAVAAASEALAASAGATDCDYSVFGRALLVAKAALRNSPSANAADTRLNYQVALALDCLTAEREAWQAELQQRWDPHTYGSPQYWNTLHPALGMPGEGPLAPAEVRRLCRERAAEMLAGATDLAR